MTDQSTAQEALLTMLKEDGKVVLYRPRLSRMCGTTSAILLQQMYYRYNGKPFYKLKAPCSSRLYTVGDSWCEELGFLPGEFDTALRRISTKCTKGKNKTELLAKCPDIPQPVATETKRQYIKRLSKALKYLIIFWTDSDHVTWYSLNRDLFAKLLIAIYIDKLDCAIHGLNGESQFIFIIEPKKTNKEKDSSPKSSDGDTQLMVCIICQEEMKLAGGGITCSDMSVQHIVWCDSCANWLQTLNREDDGHDDSVHIYGNGYCVVCQASIIGRTNTHYWDADIYTCYPCNLWLQTLNRDDCDKTFHCVRCNNMRDVATYGKPIPMIEDENPGSTGLWCTACFDNRPTYRADDAIDSNLTITCPRCNHGFDVDSNTQEVNCPGCEETLFPADFIVDTPGGSASDVQLTANMAEVLERLAANEGLLSSHQCYLPTLCDLKMVTEMPYHNKAKGYYWAITDDGRATLEAYQAQQKPTMTELADEILVPTSEDYLYSLPISDKAIIATLQAIQAGEGNVNKDAYAECENRELIVHGEITSGGYDLLEESSEPEQLPTSDTPLIDQADAMLATKEKVKAKRKAKKPPSADTLMKNACLQAMGYTKEDITCWDKWRVASKKLRATNCTPEDILDLYNLTLRESVRQGWEFKDPMAMVSRWPALQKQRRLQAEREAATATDSGPMDASAGVIEQEL